MQKFIFFTTICILSISFSEANTTKRCKDRNAENLGSGCVCKKDFVVKGSKCVIDPAICFMVNQALDDLQSTTKGFWAMKPVFGPGFRSAGVKTEMDLVEEEEPKKKMNELQKLALMATMFRDDILAQCGLMCGCQAETKFLFSGMMPSS